MGYVYILVSWSEWEPWTSRPEPGCKGRTRKCINEDHEVVDNENCPGESCSTDPGSTVFIIGGRRGGDSKKIYAFSLNPNVPVKECQRKDGEFPLALNYPSMAIFPELCSESGFPTVCGGGSYGPWPLGGTTFKDCYKFNLDAKPRPVWENVGAKNYVTYATGL